MSGRVFDLKKQNNLKRRADYRRLNKYVKSLEQTKRERAMRLRVLELWFAGWVGLHCYVGLYVDVCGYIVGILSFFGAL